MTNDLNINRVRILQYDSPARIIVRFVTWEKNFYRLKDAMNKHFRRLRVTENSEKPSLSTESVVCVLLDSQWYRAKVIEKDGNLGGKLKVKLVDTGEIKAVLAERVRFCPTEFLEDRAFSFRCHLQGVPDVGWTEDDRAKQVKQMLPEAKIVNLRTVVNGKPVLRSWSEKDVELTEYSLPCDLTWCSDSEEDPFSPSGRTFNSLVDICLKFVGVEANNFDEDISEENLDVGEFCDIKKQEASPTFHWPPPQLPESREFSARGVFVDPSGQIYVQLNSLRHTAHDLRKLLMEKFKNSQPDEDHGENPMTEGQCCCVKWGDPKVDGGWLRGKFLHYTNSNRTRAKVYLVDYGNPFEADVMREVRRDIYAARVPILALRLELAEVTPLGPNGTYSEECLDIIQEKIAYKIRGAKKNRKLKIQVVGSFNKLPLSVNILFEEDKVMLDLAELLAHFHFVERKSNKKPSSLFRERRLNWSKHAVDAVPFGLYKEKNFYALIRDTTELDDLDYKVDHSLNYLDWTMTTLAPGDVMKVEIVEYGDYRTVFLHCADPDQEYLCQMLDEYDNIFEDIQAECEDMPPVFQPRVGMLVCAQTKDGWYRAVITGYTERDITVRFVDWGNTAIIRDSMKVKEIPEVFAKTPSLAIKLELEIESCVAESEQDIVASLMRESLASPVTMMGVGVVITRLGEAGVIRGHLVSLDTGVCLYKGLQREGIIVITE